MTKARHHEDEVVGGAHCASDRPSPEVQEFARKLTDYISPKPTYGKSPAEVALPGIKQPSTLPTADADRKKLPIFDGVLKYFPNALLAVAEVSRVGNDQHNPGEPLHWAKDKSTDHFNTNIRHQIDHATGNRYDIDKTRHLAKAAWRILAALETDILNEREGK